mmetsp:Transcript_31939/g.93897  ORF Transcript_31939/g.93897 Transcript_31939/m.93897 type:complete len:205 (+) Transcript_31939:272-886(+)
MDLAAAAADTVAGHYYRSSTVDKGVGPAAAAGEIGAEAAEEDMHSSPPSSPARRQLPRPTLHTAAHIGHIAADCIDSAQPQDTNRDSSSAEAANIVHPAAAVGSTDKDCTADTPAGMDRPALAVADSQLLAGCTRRQKMAETAGLVAGTDTVTVSMAATVVAHKPAVAVVVAETAAAPQEEVAHRDPPRHHRAAQSHQSCPHYR